MRFYSIRSASPRHERKIQQVVVLGNATDTDVFAPSSVADKSPLTMHKKPNPFVLGFSGELREKKGLIPFMEAFDRLSRLIPVRALVVVRCEGLINIWSIVSLSKGRIFDLT